MAIFTTKKIIMRDGGVPPHLQTAWGSLGAHERADSPLCHGKTPRDIACLLRYLSRGIFIRRLSETRIGGEKR